MSDERKEWLLKHIDYVFNECRRYIESKNNDCLNCLEGAETCYQAHEEIKRLIQQKPEIDLAYVEEKADRFMLRCPGITSASYKSIKSHVKKFLTQIIKETRSLGDVPVVKIKENRGFSRNEKSPQEVSEVRRLTSDKKIKKQGGD